MNATPNAPLRWYNTGNGRVLLLLGAALGTYGVVQNWDQVVYVLPWLFIAACPLLHVFMHGGQSRQGGQDREEFAGYASKPARAPHPAPSEEEAY